MNTSQKYHKTHDKQARITNANVAAFRCGSCRGKASIVDGRVTVRHRPKCALFIRLALTHPRFLATLDMYRYPTATKEQAS